MVRILKWLVFILVGAGILYLGVQFVLVNTEPELQPQFVLIYGSRYAWHLSEPWPAGLLILATFVVGVIGGLIIAVIAGAGMEMRILRFRKEIRNLRREVESLRVSDLDEDVERELGPDLDDDELLSSSPRLRPPVTGGAAAGSFDEDGDTNVDYERLIPHGDLDENEDLRTRKAVDSD